MLDFLNIDNMNYFHLMFYISVTLLLYVIISLIDKFDSAKTFDSFDQKLELLFVCALWPIVILMAAVFIIVLIGLIILWVVLKVCEVIIDLIHLSANSLFNAVRKEPSDK